MADLSKDHNWQPGGGGTDEEVFRVCPVCNRVGNKMLCGPHIKPTMHAQGIEPIHEPLRPGKTPLSAATVPHPDAEVQAAYRFGGVEAAVDMLGRKRRDLLAAGLGDELRKWDKAGRNKS